MQKLWLLPGIIFLLIAFPLYAIADSTISDDEVLNFLKERLSTDRLYPRMECIFFFTEDPSPKQLTIALREKHDDKCGGDPELAPTIDRYRVTRLSKKIEWYDAIEDDFKPYSEAVKSRMSK